MGLFSRDRRRLLCCWFFCWYVRLIVRINMLHVFSVVSAGNAWNSSLLLRGLWVGKGVSWGKNLLTLLEGINRPAFNNQASYTLRFVQIICYHMQGLRGHAPQSSVIRTKGNCLGPLYSIALLAVRKHHFFGSLMASK